MDQGNTILGADYCPYCVKVKDYFTSNKIPFNWIDTETTKGEAIRSQESAKHNWKTIPMVYVQGKFVGGCDDFFKALKNKSFSFSKL